LDRWLVSTTILHTSHMSISMNSICYGIHVDVLQENNLLMTYSK